MWTTCRSLCCPVAAALCLALGFGDAPAGAADRSTAHVADLRTRFALGIALDDAARALARPRCLEVLDRFRDAAGEPLRLRLSARGTDAPGFLRELVFYEGTGKAACRAGSYGPMAVTEVGSRVVWVCPGAFAARGGSDPGLAEAIVIHEMLHALGLGENPPASLEITAEVRRRCVQ